jgi:hypothetical protein
LANFPSQQEGRFEFSGGIEVLRATKVTRTYTISMCGGPNALVATYLGTYYKFNNDYRNLHII